MSGCAACDQYDGIGLAALVRRREVRADAVLEAAIVCTVALQTVMAGCQPTCLLSYGVTCGSCCARHVPGRGVQDTGAAWSRAPGTPRREENI
jgi:hypothetical protein